MEHHIQCGNSLLGATPALLKKGIPDEAFEPLEGDDKAICRIFKKKNKAEREGGQGSLLETLHEPSERLADLARAVADLDAIPGDTSEGQRAKQDRWEQLVRSNSYESGRLSADAWCAAFVWRKVDDPHLPYPITEAVFRRFEKDPFSVPDWMRQETRRLADAYQFLHWQVAFPSVFVVGKAVASGSTDGPGWSGGFDLVLGNPPWEQQQVSEQEFFSERAADIAAAAGAARKKRIESLREADPALHAAFLASQRQAGGGNQLIRDSGRYPLCGRGKLNTYAVFAELNRSLLGAKGRAGFIVPSGIATDDTTKFFFGDVIERSSLASLYEFENEGFFLGAGQGHMNRFCLITLSGSEGTGSNAEFLFQGNRVAELKDPDRRLLLSAEDFRLLNPNTRTCPIFRTRRDAEITKRVYRHVPILVDERKGDAGNPWRVDFRQGLFNMTSDSGLFRTAKELQTEDWILAGNAFQRGAERCVPLYEAKMIYQFNHRHGSYELLAPGERTHVLPTASADRLSDPAYTALPYYWVPETEVEGRLKDRWDRRWLLGWRDVTDARASARTVIASVIPRVGAGDTFLLMFPASAPDAITCLLANLDSFVLDYVARQKVGGTHLKYHVFKQLAVLPPSAYDVPASWAAEETARAWIARRVLELVYTSWDLQPFARDVGYDGPPFRWDADRRFQLRCELDAAFFHLYGIEREDVAYIMDTFPIVRDKDEKAFGLFRTKKQILVEYQTLDTGRTALDSQSRVQIISGEHTRS